jgi:hypothetical protein
MIRRYDHRLPDIGSAIAAEYTSVEELPCPDLHGCIGEIHGLMYTAMLTEETDDFAYALWVNDDGDTFPCYVIQRNPEAPGTLVNFMTPDVYQLFEEVGGQDWHNAVLDIEFHPGG